MSKGPPTLFDCFFSQMGRSRVKKKKEAEESEEEEEEKKGGGERNEMCESKLGVLL